MDSKPKKVITNKVAEPTVSYSISPLPQKGIDTSFFDFDKEIRAGFSIEVAKQESVKRIRGWWKK